MGNAWATRGAVLGVVTGILLGWGFAMKIMAGEGAFVRPAPDGTGAPSPATTPATFHVVDVRPSMLPVHQDLHWAVTDWLENPTDFEDLYETTARLERAVTEWLIEAQKED